MAYTDRNLSNLTISESFWRLMQTDPVDDVTLLDGTGSLVTYLAVSGTIDAFYFKGDGSQLTNIPTSSLPFGLVSSSAQLGLSSSDSPTFANLIITNKITAQEFHTEFVSASIIYESGSTKFGNSSDDIHSFTGSLRVNGSITGSLFGTASYSNFSNTSSYIDPLFISASVVAFGLSGASEWDDVQNKPAGLVSSSAQTIANLFGTNIVSGSGQRSVLGLGETDSPTFANGNYTGNLVIGGTLTARTYIISSSVVNYETIQVSGSTKFGDTLDDTHQFTGSVNITGSLSLSNTAYINTLFITNSYVSNNLYVTGSTKFGTSLSDTHQFTGSILVSGSTTFSGENTIIQGDILEFTGSAVFTGSLQVEGEFILPSINQLPVISSTGSLIISASSAYLYL